jgi:hypothetical protein
MIFAVVSYGFQNEMSRHKRVGQFQPLRQHLDLVAFGFGQPDGEDVFTLRLPNRWGRNDRFVRTLRSFVLRMLRAYHSEAE